MAKPISLLVVLFAAAFGLFGSGCDSYTSPVLSVNKVEPTERTPDGCAMLFTIDAQNNNDEPLPLRTVDYRLDLNGKQVFTGTRWAEATLRRLGTQQFKLPAVMELTPETRALAEGVTHYRLSGSLYYVTPGRLAQTLFDSGVRTPNVGFAFEGDVDLSKATFTAPAETPAPASTTSTPAAPSVPAEAPK